MTRPVHCRARCGRTLTDPVSLARGYGPVCWAHLPATVQAVITAALPPTPATSRTPRIRRTRHARPATPADTGQLELDTEETQTMSDTTPAPQLCWGCHGAGVLATEDGEDAFECTICEGSGLADSSGGPIIADDTEA